MFRGFALLRWNGSEVSLNKPHIIIAFNHNFACPDDPGTLRSMNHPPRQPLIALLTDFGTSDPYVGVMKGVIATRCPSAQVIDITHEVRPQNVQQGAYLLRTAYRYFPAHTIFVAVVDPGVGTARQPVGIETSHGVYVGPDNGIFSSVLQSTDIRAAVVLYQPVEPISTTFHGRDVFAPAAADLACGRPLQEMGLSVDPISLIRLPSPKMDLIHETILEGEVLHIDHFGNVITSLGRFEWHAGDLILTGREEIRALQLNARTARVIFGGRTVSGHVISPIQATYGDAVPGHLLALIGSDGQLEIAINQGSAATLLDARIGESVYVEFEIPKES